MTYTTDQAVQMAREVYTDSFLYGAESVTLDKKELTALCNKVREQTLLEAAEILIDGGYISENYAEDVRRRMAGEG